MPMIPPQTWDDHVFMDGAYGRTQEERVIRLLYVWRAMQDPTGNFREDLAPEVIRAFLQSQGFGMPGPESPNGYERFEDAVSGVAASSREDDTLREVEDAVLEAMRADAPDGFEIIESEDGDILYMSTEEAKRYGWLED